MLILAGQGNPGPKYAHNRHNAGFILLDYLHAKGGFPAWRSRFDSQAAEAALTLGGQRYKILLLKPQTFYNRSGLALSKAAAFYKTGAEAVTVFHDEIDLAPGRVRVKRGGGLSGNNGIRSVVEHLGPDIRRVRIGVGHPGDKAQVMPYVLSDFTKAERAWFDPLCAAIWGSMPFLLEGDDERFQTEVMRLAPAPKRDPRQDARPPANPGPE
jgi:PTH1 family peptidyl-tRNA hydrolase